LLAQPAQQCVSPVLELADQIVLLVGGLDRRLAVLVVARLVFADLLAQRTRRPAQARQVSLDLGQLGPQLGLR
jgi:hypothetical protein